MKKRRSIIYTEPNTLSDLRKIVKDTAKSPAETRVWIRHNGDGSINLPLWYSIEINQGMEDDV